MCIFWSKPLVLAFRLSQSWPHPMYRWHDVVNIECCCMYILQWIFTARVARMYRFCRLPIPPSSEAAGCAIQSWADSSVSFLTCRVRWWWRKHSSRMAVVHTFILCPTSTARTSLKRSRNSTPKLHCLSSLQRSLSLAYFIAFNLHDAMLAWYILWPFVTTDCCTYICYLCPHIGDSIVYVAKASEWWLSGREFEPRPPHCWVTTLGKMFTPRCLCHQAL